MQTPAERALGSLKKHGAWLQNKGRGWFVPRQEVWSLAATQGMERPGKVCGGNRPINILKHLSLYSSIRSGTLDKHSMYFFTVV
jgi:hypothetical protein